MRAAARGQQEQGSSLSLLRIAAWLPQQQHAPPDLALVEQCALDLNIMWMVARHTDDHPKQRYWPVYSPSQVLVIGPRTQPWCASLHLVHDPQEKHYYAWRIHLTHANFAIRHAASPSGLAGIWHGEAPHLPTNKLRHRPAPSVLDSHAPAPQGIVQWGWRLRWREWEKPTFQPHTFTASPTERCCIADNPT